MKILFSSYTFPPSVGGIEVVSAMLAQEFARCGHEVRVVTETQAADEEVSFDYEVIRRPRPAQLIDLVRWSDVVFHNNISLRGAWPMLFIHRPWIITHATWIKSGLSGTLKRFALRFATNVAISRAIGDDLKVPSVLIPNPYDSSLFCDPLQVHERELLYVGRLVSDKGVHVLLQALERLNGVVLKPRLTIVGGGPEEAPLRRLAGELGLAERVTFAGVKRGRALVEELGRHLIMVIPSLWQEPFGVVALEGIACGCVVIGSSGGGLPDAIGPCGLTFPNGDAGALASCLARLLSSQVEREALNRFASAHLQKHTVGTIAQSYLAVFTKLLDAGRTSSVGSTATFG